MISDDIWSNLNQTLTIQDVREMMACNVEIFAEILKKFPTYPTVDIQKSFDEMFPIRTNTRYLKKLQGFVAKI